VPPVYGRAGLTGALALALCWASACTTAQAPPSPPPSPPALAYTPFSPQTPSGYTPSQPLRELRPGVLARTIYTAETRGRYSVEIWEILAGGAKISDSVTLPGAAVIEIASGQGVFTIAGKTREVRTGDVFSFDEGQPFTIENRTPGGGLMIRASVIRRSGN